MLLPRNVCGGFNEPFTDSLCPDAKVALDSISNPLELLVATIL